MMRIGFKCRFTFSCYIKWRIHPLEWRFKMPCILVQLNLNKQNLNQPKGMMLVVRSFQLYWLEKFGWQKMQDSITFTWLSNVRIRSYRISHCHSRVNLVKVLSNELGFQTWMKNWRAYNEFVRNCHLCL